LKRSGGKKGDVSKRGVAVEVVNGTGDKQSREAKGGGEKRERRKRENRRLRVYWVGDGKTLSAEREKIRKGQGDP